ncbi:hypothetical protein [Plasmodium yoelii yoelii]|uniref:Uncharacterized protein n=1 Tax=Plasmodium yoelii yoelii TaxID=73239 RepID=Q7PCU9_PLAYO|nr:hypothetical protein [Plasmodium yoelii yoelii]EAA18405.1 hypothetical protein [Plasmodium yoelii yoelii]EAA20791.1 hypothetical protein [Plasmodium yoelii yoelii]
MVDDTYQKLYPTKLSLYALNGALDWIPGKPALPFIRIQVTDICPVSMINGGCIINGPKVAKFLVG